MGVWGKEGFSAIAKEQASFNEVMVISQFANAHADFSYLLIKPPPGPSKCNAERCE